MRRWILAVVCWGVLSPLGSLAAQRPITIGIGGGVSEPQGDLRDGVSTGWHALGTLAWSPLMLPLGLRLDGAYNRFAFSDEAETGLGGEGEQTTSSATLNATYRLPMTDSPMSPYLISGLGAYHTECSLGPGCDGTIRYGWNVGLGAKFFVLGFRSFLEARYHRTERGEMNANYFPVTFGITL
jgi:hypothetical protein